MINRTQLIRELMKIRAMMDENITKAKQMLTNLEDNIIEGKGKCFK